MEFPIVDLLDVEESLRWIEQHFHPEGLHCPRCQAPVAEARVFRRTKRSGLTVYRCKRCGRTYNMYTGTVFEQHHLSPPQVVLLLRGIAKGESSRTLAAELAIGYQTVLTLRHEIQAQAERLQPETPLPDQEVEADEMFQNAGEKRRTASQPERPAPPPGESTPRAWNI